MNVNKEDIEVEEIEENYDGNTFVESSSFSMSKRKSNSLTINEKKSQEKNKKEELARKSLKLIHYKAFEKDNMIIENEVRLVKNDFIQDKQLIPYYHDWKVILRNQLSNQVVLYNQENHELAIANSQQSPEEINTEQPNVKCQLCNQPLPRYYDHNMNADEEATEHNIHQEGDYSHNGSGNGNNNIDFMDKNYFKCLAISHEQKRMSHLLTEDNKQKNFQEEGLLNASTFNQGYYNRFFKEVRKLGHGASGNVYLCQHFLDSIKLGSYAIKKVSIGHNHSWLARLLREVHMLERLHHQNIIDYKHAWIENHKPSPFSPEVPCLFILMECANGGNLEEYIEKRKGRTLNNEDNIDLNSLTPKERALYMRRQKGLMEDKKLNETKDYNLLTLKEIWSLFLDICNGLAHLHNYNIIHRDVKPPNLLLSYKEGSKKNNEIPRVLISDFGECVNIENTNGAVRTGATGTLEFMAPELIKVDHTGTYIGEHSSKADMWSLGMILYYLCYSKLPYKQIEDIDILKDEILRFKEITIFPDDLENTPRIPVVFKQLIVLLLSNEPNKRPDAHEILKRANEVNFEKLIPGVYTRATEIFNNTSPQLSSDENLRNIRNAYKPKVSSPLISQGSSKHQEAIPLIESNSINRKIVFKEINKDGHMNPVLLIILGLKLATLILPCYPKSISIFALVPLTTLAVWGVTFDSRPMQLAFLMVHALLLFIIYIYLGGLCS